MEHAFSFNYILYRELVKTVDIPVQERNAICRIVASVESLMRYYITPIKIVHFTHRDDGIATVATIQ